ncbi:MAG: hypothetical protein AAF317_05035 [Pseudomonadota bacterium]
MALALDRNLIFLVIRMTLFTLLGLLAVFIEVAPLGLTAGALPSPDLLACLVACWTLRRPEAAPIVLVFLLGICRDLLSDTPPGAGTLSLVLMTQVLLSWRAWLVIRPFVVEWLIVAIAIVAMLFLQWAIIVLTLGHPPYVTEMGVLALVTMLAYPPVALILRWGLGVSWQKVSGRSGRAL